MPWAAIIPALIGAAGVGTSIAGTVQQGGALNSAKKIAAADAKRREEIFQLIKPFATMLQQFGINPAEFLKSAQGQAILGPAQEAVTKNFGQGRQNLVDMLGQSGLSTGSGVAAGPIANSYLDESKAHSDNTRSMIANALNLGLQGSNLLAGQQASFNPYASQELLQSATEAQGANFRDIIGGLAGLFGLFEDGTNNNSALRGLWKATPQSTKIRIASLPNLSPIRFGG